jgi:hypothetical protein
MLMTSFRLVREMGCGGLAVGMQCLCLETGEKRHLLGVWSGYKIGVSEAFDWACDVVCHILTNNERY